MQQAAVRSHKNILQETLARGKHGLEIQYSDNMLSAQQSPTKQPLWVSVVRLVGSIDRSVKLEAPGQGNKKSSAQGAAAANLMARPEFEALLQQLHTPAGVATSMQHYPFAASMLASPTAAGGVNAAASLAPTTPVQQATTGQQHSPQPMDTSPPSSATATAAAAHAGAAAGQYAAPPAAARVLDFGSPPSNPAASGPFLGLSQLQSTATPATAPNSSQHPSTGTAPPSAGMQAGTAVGAAAGSASVFNPSTNYKGQLQECLQRACVAANSAINLPTYTSTAQGMPHAQVFTAAVTWVLPPSAVPAGAAASTTAPAGSQHVMFTATGAPQHSKKAAEQAAAAAALSTPIMQAVLASLHAPQPQQQQQLVLQLVPPTAVHGRTRLSPPASTATNNSSPTHQLHELVAQAGWCLEPIIPVQLGGPSHLPLFEASVVINGYLLAVAQGNSKQAASHAAAARALECMQPPSAPSPAATVAPAAPGSSSSAAPAPAPNSSSNGGSSSSYTVSPAELQEASLSLFQHFAHQACIVSHTISPARVTQTALCTFLVQQGSKRPEVVALGTGTGFFSRPLQELGVPEQRGKVLLDCHGEVVARRSLLRWLYAQAELVLSVHRQLQLLQGTAAVASLQQALDALPLELVTPGTALLPLQPSTAAAGRSAPNSNSTGIGSGSSSSGGSSSQSHGVKLRLKPDVKLHMYVSKPPCGDAFVFSKPPAISTTNPTSSSTALHFAAAKPRQRLPAAVTAASKAAQPGLLLPAQSALEAHWPQSCSLFDPDRVAAQTGLLRHKTCNEQNCHIVPESPVAVVGPWAPAAAPASPAGTADVTPPTSTAAALLQQLRAANALGDAAANAAGKVVPGVSTATGAAGMAGVPAAAGGRPGLSKMCCSDKIASYNALGLQGALLGQLLEPVYISSITIGGPAANFCEGAVCRALCCRLAPDLPINSSSSGSSSSSAPPRDAEVHESKRPHVMSAALLSLPVKVSAAVQRGLRLDAPYRVNHPKVMYAPTDSASSRWLPVPGSHQAPSSTESMNWNAAEKEQLEVVTAATGKPLQVLSIPTYQSTAAAAAALNAAIAAGAADAGSIDGVDGSSGGSDGSSGSGSDGSSSDKSRLSKAALFEWYQQLTASAGEYAALATGQTMPAQAKQGQQDTDMQQDQGAAAAETGPQVKPEAGGVGVGGQVTYAAAKARNVGYAHAKAQLHQHFANRTKQAWLKVTAVVPELEAFTG